MADLVTLGEAKAYLRVVHGKEDDLIGLMITAASDAVADIATAWDGTGDVPERLKLAVLARVLIAYTERGSVKAAAGELPMLTPLRELDT